MLSGRKEKLIKRHIIYFTVICCFVVFISVTDIRCPIYYIFGYPCPTCGVTRAMISLVKLDFEGYLFYHPLALPLVLSVLSIIHINLFKRKKPILITVYIIFNIAQEFL